MAVLIDETTRVIFRGSTGSQGAVHSDEAITGMVGGVSPGMGGQDTHHGAVTGRAVVPASGPVRAFRQTLCIWATAGLALLMATFAAPSAHAMTTAEAARIFVDACLRDAPDFSKSKAVFKRNGVRDFNPRRANRVPKSVISTVEKLNAPRTGMLCSMSFPGKAPSGPARVVRDFLKSAEFRHKGTLKSNVPLDTTGSVAAIRGEYKVSGGMVLEVAVFTGDAPGIGPLTSMSVIWKKPSENAAERGPKPVTKSQLAAARSALDLCTKTLPDSATTAASLKAAGYRKVTDGPRTSGAIVLRHPVSQVHVLVGSARRSNACIVGLIGMSPKQGHDLAAPFAKRFDMLTNAERGDRLSPESIQAWANMSRPLRRYIAAYKQWSYFNAPGAAVRFLVSTR